MDDEINQAKAEIQRLKTLERSEGRSKELDSRIASETALLTALITAQQSKFHHIFPLPLPNLLEVIIFPNLFDISSSPIQVWRLLKVRGGGSLGCFRCGDVGETKECGIVNVIPI